MHQNCVLLFVVHELVRSNARAVGIDVEGDFVVNVVFVGQQRRDFAVDMRDLDSSVLVDEQAHQVDKISHGFVNGATEDARMQILRGALDFESKVANSTETVGDTRLCGSQPVVVGNANVVGILEPGLASVEQLVETFTSGLFHSLEDELAVDWNFQSELLVAFDGVNPSENGSLVVARASAEKLSILLSQNEGLRVPSVLLQRRLHIQVSVKHDSLLRRILQLTDKECSD